jgi:uncharacterized FAD-dependent dehydrogenase
MIKHLEILLSPAEAEDSALRHSFARAIGTDEQSITGWKVRRKSIDARSRNIKFRFVADVFIGEPFVPDTYGIRLQNVSSMPEVHIIGFGPAGMFAALKLIELGLKPVIFERGKDVKERRRDLAAINKEGVVNPESNYCFGEGGAGTYSDGKLYTRSNKRGSINDVIDIFIYHGADPAIAYEAHPHIGTNKLPGIVTAIRKTIEECGGEIHFNSRLTDIESNAGHIGSITINNHSRIKTRHLILATGHSARDIFELFYRKKFFIEAKPLAIGVRVEHPQQIIDSSQYKCSTRPGYLPPASYSLVTQVKHTGVFSFCMCPGGIIAPASTSPGEVVVNGWSPSKRSGRFANSGMVVSIDEKEYLQYAKHGPLASLKYQMEVEQNCFKSAGNSIKAPAQRIADFIHHKPSSTLPECSYIPGLTSTNLHEVLPSHISTKLKLALEEFGRKIKGYTSHEAIMVATESRTSSPVRISRDAETLEHVEIKGLYPCAEGAGYAGGIMSAAMDGQNVAKAIALRMTLH